MQVHGSNRPGSLLCKDIAKLSGEHHTFRVETFHSIVYHCAHKMYVYSHTGMQCRYLLSSITVQSYIVTLQHEHTYLAINNV